MSDKKLLLLMEKNPGRAIHELMNLYGDSISAICRDFWTKSNRNELRQIMGCQKDSMKRPTTLCLASILWMFMKNLGRS